MFPYSSMKELKLKKIALALVALVIATPAMAADFTGPRVEVTAGVDDFRNVRDFNDVTYGVAVGLDTTAITDKVIVGVEASVDNVFNKQREIAGSVRLGYVVAPNVLVYGKAGYANLSDAFAGKNLDGVRVGGGLEIALTDNIYTGAEYRYSDLSNNVGKHQGLVKIGFRF